MAPLHREIALLPTAIATETVRPVHNALRRAPGGGEPLQFAIGARIVGIQFPPEYKGEWCIGWADGKRAAFPAEAVRLDPPPRSEVRAPEVTPVRGQVRWKWSVKDKTGTGEWLKLDKNDTISNISCECCITMYTKMRRINADADRNRGYARLLVLVRDNVEGQVGALPAVAHRPELDHAGHRRRQRRDQREEPRAQGVVERRVAGEDVVARAEADEQRRDERQLGVA
jgi:hypothetical protein